MSDNESSLLIRRWPAAIAVLLFMTGLLIGAPASAQVGVVDDGGANDAVGQNDLTRFFRDDTDPDFLTVLWSWDEPSAITGVGQAVNACALFDTDGDGNINDALCLEVSDQDGDGNLEISQPDPPDPDTWFPHWIECSDAKDDRCTQPNRLGDPVELPDGLGNTTCEITVAETDPFDATAPNGPGSDYPDDIEANCEIDRDIIPEGGELINVCSYPSAGNDGNNNPFDCVVTPGAGFLVITKIADPDDGTQFDFTLDPAATNGETSFMIFGSGSTDLIPVNPVNNPFSITEEIIEENWGLDEASCETNGGASTGTFNGTDALTGIEFGSGQTTTCTFTNSIATQPLGLLTLNKVVNGGTALPSAWTLSVELNEGSDERCTEAGFSGSSPASGNVSLTDDNATCTYTLSESGGPSSYIAGDWTCGEGASVDGDQLVVTADSASCTITNNFAELSVNKPAPTNADDDGSGDVSVGDVLTYTITATNTGEADLTNVVVTDNKITPTGGTTPCALVTPGNTCTLIGTYTVTVADVTAGRIDNLATADSNETDPVTDPETVPVPSPSLSIDKVYNGISIDADNSGDVSAGDTLSYTITATNNGTANLTNVTVSDSLTSDSTTCSGPLAPLATCVLNTTYVVQVSDLGTTISNTGTADSDQTGPETDMETVPVPQPSMTIDKTVVLDGGSCPGVDPLNLLSNLDGSSIQVQYCYKVTNDGTANLTDIVVTDDPNGSIGTIALLEPGNMETLKSDTVTLTGAGPFDNIGTANSDQTGPVNDPAQVNVAVGCTLTQGYWMTHSRFGPAPRDERWNLIGPAGAETTFFLSGQTYYEVLRMPTKGNPYYSLAQQYIAAALNLAVNTGRDAPDAVEAAVSAAEELYNTYTPAQVKRNKSVQRQFKMYIGILTSFNEGLQPGFPHCDDLPNFNG